MKRFVLLLVLTAASVARGDDKCFEHIQSIQTTAAAVWWWDGSGARLASGSVDASGDVIYYFTDKKPLQASDLHLASPPDAHTEPNGGPCGKLLYWSIKHGQPTNQTQPLVTTPAAEVTLDDIVSSYRGGKSGGKRTVAYSANSATSVAEEAVQILGQIVVDRASNAAYAMILDKVKGWLKCSETNTKLPATCAVLSSLRLQDIAMAPDQLRAALLSDAMGFIKLEAAAKLGMRDVAHPVFAPDTGAAAPAHCGSGLAGDDMLCLVEQLVANAIVPVLARPITKLTGHPAEVMVRAFVDKGLDHLVSAADKAGTLCGKLAPREHVLALAAAGVAACEAQQTEGTKCQIMTVVEKLQHDYCSAKPLTDDQLLYAQSTAGNFWDALTLTKAGGVTDNDKRLVAALEGGFAVACMYANAEAGPYACEVDASKHGKPSAAEAVALLRDVAIAAANRDGAAMGRVIIVAIERLLPPADCQDCSKAIRMLATIAAYAATYSSTTANSDDAHKQRTALLESLTADMTHRTERGGDTIVSVGGSLRAVFGGRISRPYTAEDHVDSAIAAPLSLPLGFAVDWLCANNTHGWHLELGIVDLGQYLSWNSGAELATFDLATALSPSLTFAKTWHRELPFFIGVTAGYTPSFDFESNMPGAKKGAYNIGATAGFYVPLFDFN